MIYQIVRDHGRNGELRAYPQNHQPRLAAWQYLGSAEAQTPTEALRRFGLGQVIERQAELDLRQLSATSLPFEPPAAQDAIILAASRT